MEKPRFRSYLNDLEKKGKSHSCFKEIKHAYKNLSNTGFGIRYSDDALFNEYNNLCNLMLHYFKKSDDRVLSSEMDTLKIWLNEDLLIQQLQLLLIDSILNYALKNFGIESPKVPKIVLLKRDKPISTPAELMKLAPAIQLKSILSKELKTPTANLTVEACYGRLALFLYMTTGICFDELITIINKPNALVYLDGLVFWYSKTRSQEKRYVLCDAVVLLLLQHKASFDGLEKKQINKNKLIEYITIYLTCASGDSWKSLSLLKLRALRKVDTIINLSPIDYQMYLGPTTCTELPQTAFLRLISNKALVADEIAKQPKKFNELNKLLSFDSDSFDYIEPKLIIVKLECTYKRLRKLNSQRVSRS
ncbi:hypothetical protein I6F53_19925 [Pseudoalteromonas sp. SWN29]|uniref:hypothetical protein n=1 Tax=Pseudoalteromonas sp. SWN29 TaxID=2792064 RepID=UPI0018CC9893|nr:hypothetical protein [Pseudoalteromonas sp. SWN29]MBH0029225.1 hypothetical protein [Pseudoalteromonas sp. SWN29]